MKIGFDAKRVFCNFRGLGNYSRTLLEGLFKYFPENEYILYTPRLRDPRGREWRENNPSCRVVTPRNFFSRSFPSLWRSLLLGNVIKKDGPDIYHGLSHELPPFCCRRGTKKIVTIHDLLYLRFPQFFPWIDRQVYHRKFSYSCRRADVVAAICRQTKDDLVEYLKVPEEKIEIAYQSCNPIFYDQLPDYQKKRIVEKYNLPPRFMLYVGPLVENKNISLILKAFSRLNKSHDINLVIVGRATRHKEDLVNLVQQLKIKNKVQFLDNVPTEDLPAIYQNAGIFVWPSFFEGFGIPIIEALFSGTPVITSKGSCFAESGGPSSMYVDPHSVDELEVAMETLLVSEGKVEEMVRQGRDYVQRFHLEKTTKRIMEIYRL